MLGYIIAWSSKGCMCLFLLQDPCLDYTWGISPVGKGGGGGGGSGQKTIYLNYIKVIQSKYFMVKV